LTPKHRVVVTGVGLVSPLGIGTEATWAALVAGRSGAAPITLFDASQHSTRFACEVKGFDPLRWVEKKDVKKMDRFVQIAVAASDLAVKDAALADGIAAMSMRVRVTDILMRDVGDRQRLAAECMAFAEDLTRHARA